MRIHDGYKMCARICLNGDGMGKETNCIYEPCSRQIV